MNGTIEAFDGGSFIVEDAYKKLNAIELSQISHATDGQSQYKMYPQNELPQLVSGTTNSVFGTCFVTYSCFDYVEFCKNYNTKDIYHFGIYEDKEIGYNSLLLSPKGLSWAKNFSKIVFLSPIIDKNFISALNKVTDAEIYLPLDREGGDPRKFSGVDLSRECFGRIFKTISNKNNKGIYNIFDLYDKCQIAGVSFASFYSALLVFAQLELISIVEGESLLINVNKNVKRELTSSAIYNQLALIKETQKGEADHARKSKTNR